MLTSPNKFPLYLLAWWSFVSEGRLLASFRTRGHDCTASPFLLPLYCIQMGHSCSCCSSPCEHSRRFQDPLSLCSAMLLWVSTWKCSFWLRVSAQTSTTSSIMSICDWVVLGFRKASDLWVLGFSPASKCPWYRLCKLWLSRPPSHWLMVSNIRQTTSSSANVDDAALPESVWTVRLDTIVLTPRHYKIFYQTSLSFFRNLLSSLLAIGHYTPVEPQKPLASASIMQDHLRCKRIRICILNREDVYHQVILCNYYYHFSCHQNAIWRFLLTISTNYDTNG